MGRWLHLMCISFAQCFFTQKTWGSRAAFPRRFVKLVPRIPLVLPLDSWPFQGCRIIPTHSCTWLANARPLREA